MHPLGVIIAARKMHVGVDHPRHERAPGQIDDAVGITRLRDVVPAGDDLLPLDQYTAPFDQAAPPIDNTTAGEERTHENPPRVPPFCMELRERWCSMWLLYNIAARTCKAGIAAMPGRTARAWPEWTAWGTGNRDECWF